MTEITVPLSDIRVVMVRCRGVVIDDGYLADLFRELQKDEEIVGDAELVVVREEGGCP
jgi:hypothetical protein